MQATWEILRKNRQKYFFNFSEISIYWLDIKHRVRTVLNIYHDTKSCWVCMYVVQNDVMTSPRKWDEIHDDIWLYKLLLEYTEMIYMS